ERLPARGVTLSERLRNSIGDDAIRSNRRGRWIDGSRRARNRQEADRYEAQGGQPTLRAATIPDAQLSHADVRCNQAFAESAIFWFFSGSVRTGLPVAA